ncbi:MAG: helix-turn-helix domain-containing protein [Candidatus Melainabacteria bacterium]|jgi:DNA-binding HxlR family transcriptional regulator|nr:helix-turn-helix domain-containing protein [Candidatus Melainabacteria bacterium]
MMMMPTAAKATKPTKADAKKATPEVASKLIEAFQAEETTVSTQGGANHDLLEKSLRVVGDKYSLQILNLLLQSEAQRFVQLEATIQGISPRTLSARLKHLEAHGLLSRKAYATIPPKVEYRITEKGMAITPIVVSLSQWVTLLDPTVVSKKS